MKQETLPAIEYYERLLKIKKKAPKNAPVGVFLNAHPEMEKHRVKVRNVFYGHSRDLKILEMFEKLFIKPKAK